ncbi:hypothetical protein ABT026_17970 [Streptomyces sp. NPDC002734]
MSSTRSDPLAATPGCVALYDATKNPGPVPGEQFHTGLTEAFATWMRS